MRFIELDQRTDEWKKWRLEGITATESGVILGLSPYKTPWRLWMEKTGRATPPDLSGNPFVRYGVEHEDDARMVFEHEHQTCVLPACAEYDGDPIFRASFDGLTPDNEPVEIKCPSPSMLEDVLANGTSSKAYRTYYPQVQHQLLVSEAQKGWLVFYDDGRIHEFEIARDEAMIAEILEKGKAFRELIVRDKAPPKDPSRDVFIPEGEDAETWISLARCWLEADLEVARLKEAVERQQGIMAAALKGLCALMPSDAAEADFAGISVKRSSVQGRVDYKKLIADKGIDESEVEAYRGQPTERINIRATGSDMPKDIVDTGLAEKLETEVDSSLFW